MRSNAQADVRTRGYVNVPKRGNARVQTRRDAKNRSSANTNLRADIRTDRRQAFSDDVRVGVTTAALSAKGASLRVGIGTSDPYYGYGYGYDDGYNSYAAAEPYASRGYGDGSYSYGAASGWAAHRAVLCRELGDSGSRGHTGASQPW